MIKGWRIDFNVLLFLHIEYLYSICVNRAAESLARARSGHNLSSLAMITIDLLEVILVNQASRPSFELMTSWTQTRGLTSTKRLAVLKNVSCCQFCLSSRTQMCRAQLKSPCVFVFLHRSRRRITCCILLLLAVYQRFFIHVCMQILELWFCQQEMLFC